MPFFNHIGPARRDGGFALDGYWIWDPGVVAGPDGRWHMFASRWPMRLPMHPGWLIASEVIRAEANDPQGPYTFAEVVLPPRGRSFWDGRATHNPRIMAHGGRYYLFYTGITYEGQPDSTLTMDDPCVIAARASKRIGVAVADDPRGPWQRPDAPALPTCPDTFYSFLTSNAAPCIADDGSTLMIFKSRRHVGNSHSSMMLGLAAADSPTGPYRVIVDQPIFGPERFGEVEDPFLWHGEDGQYHLIAKDMTGRLCGEQGGGVAAVSSNGVDWQLADPPTAYTRRIRYTDGQLLTLGAFERVSLILQDKTPTHLLAAVSDGPGGFTRASRTWNIVLPLR